VRLGDALDGNQTFSSPRELSEILRPSRKHHSKPRGEETAPELLPGMNPQQKSIARTRLGSRVAAPRNQWHDELLTEEKEALHDG
jgi:hypothetical protein